MTGRKRIFITIRSQLNLLIVFSILSAFLSCSDNQKGKTDNIAVANTTEISHKKIPGPEDVGPHGSYYYRSDSLGHERIIHGIKDLSRGWGMNLWELTLDKKPRTLKYSESHGFGNFEITISVDSTSKGNLLLKFDSIIYKCAFMRTAIDNMDKGDPVLELYRINDKLYSKSGILNFYERDRRMLDSAVFYRRDSIMTKEYLARRTRRNDT